MIDLRKDLFARLAISANKKKHFNKPFRTVKSDVDWLSEFLSKEDSIIQHESRSLEKELLNSSTSGSVGSIKMNSIIRKYPETEKIDETVENIVGDPTLIEVQLELEFAEKLLEKIKSLDKHNPKIPIIKKTITQLRILLDQKMYI
ncbi:MAG: hypothetical protein ACP5OA_01550 [Candidatus Woesearchaeota archaeon]